MKEKQNQNRWPLPMLLTPQQLEALTVLMTRLQWREKTIRRQGAAMLWFGLFFWFIALHVVQAGPWEIYNGGPETAMLNSNVEIPSHTTVKYSGDVITITTTAATAIATNERACISRTALIDNTGRCQIGIDNSTLTPLEYASKGFTLAFTFMIMGTMVHYVSGMRGKSPEGL